MPLHIYAFRKFCFSQLEHLSSSPNGLSYTKSPHSHITRAYCHVADSQTCPKFALQNNSSEASSKAHHKSYRSIPGPPRLPFIGSLFDFKIGRKQVDYYHEYLRELYEKYGPIVREDQGSVTIIHIFDPEDIRTVFFSTTVPYVVPLLPTSKDYKKENHLGLSLGDRNGPEWEKLRKAINKLTLKPQAANSYFPMQDNIAKQAIDLMGEHYIESDCTVPHLENLIDRWISESLSNVIANESTGSLDSSNQQDKHISLQLAEANRKVFELSAQLKISAGSYKLFPTPKVRALERYEHQFYGTIFKKCMKLTAEKEARINRSEDENDKSVLANMIRDTTLSKSDVIALASSLLTDGFSTTAPTLLGALHCLALSPSVQEELYSHLLQVCGPHPFIDDTVYSEMHKMQAFIREVFRIYPIGEAVQRLLTKSLVLSGYELPKGVYLDLNPYIWLKDPEVFPDPHTIRLERWSKPPGKGSITKKFHPILNTPFSLGVRTCVGRRLAEHDLACFLARLVLQYKITLATHKPPRQVYRVLLRPETPIPLLFHKRI